MNSVYIITEHRYENYYIRRILPGTSTQEQINEVIAELTAARVLGTFESSYFEYEEHQVG
jgi:hypothetical protein